MTAVPVPNVHLVPATSDSYPFSAMATAREPLDLAAYGYVEEEYFVAGSANVYAFDRENVVVEEAGLPYMTRIIVRRPTDSEPEVAWVSILNASQGYDIEDDWRRAWNYIMTKRQAYVAITAKPIQISALQTFDPARYKSLTFGGVPQQVDAAEDSWNPFMQMENSEEGLAWDVIAQIGAWLRAGDGPLAPSRQFLIGQSQSAVYTNTFLTYFHNLLTYDNRPVFDGYAPGVGSVLVKEINQRGTGIPRTIGAPLGEVEAPGTGGAQKAFTTYLVDQVDLDVPVITVSSEADVALFGGDPTSFVIGDGPMRRHWHVAGAPHSDARSRVIPNNNEVARSARLPRVMDADFLDSLISFPIEPVITAQMTALEMWAREGKAAAASQYFATEDGAFVREDGLLAGGIRMGLLVHPLAHFVPGLPSNPVLGQQELRQRADILAEYANFEEYIAEIDAVDNELEAAGYLEPIGRDLIHRVAAELWGRAVDGEQAPLSSPQRVLEN